MGGEGPALGVPWTPSLQAGPGRQGAGLTVDMNSHHVCLGTSG